MVSNPLENIDFDRWDVVWIVASLVALVTCIAAKERNGAIMATGLLIFGLGELKNHPHRQTIYDDRIVVTSRRRLNSPFGLLLDTLGIGILGWGIYKALFIP